MYGECSKTTKTLKSKIIEISDSDEVIEDTQEDVIRNHKGKTSTCTNVVKFTDIVNWIVSEIQTKNYNKNKLEIVEAITKLFRLINQLFTIYQQSDPIQAQRKIDHKFLKTELCNGCKRTLSFYRCHPCGHKLCIICQIGIAKCALCKKSTKLSKPMFIARHLYKYYILDSTCILNIQPIRIDPKVNAKGQTPLHIAAVHGHLNQVVETIREGVDINARDSVGWTPLHDASANNHFAVASLLIQCGALINVPSYDSYETPLHVAKTKEMAELLCLSGANPYALNAQLQPAYIDCQGMYTVAIKNRNIFTVRIPIVALRNVSKHIHEIIVKNPKVFHLSNNPKLHFNVTHLILGPGVKPNSMEILQAVAQRTFVLSESWVESHLNNAGVVDLSHHTIEINGVDFKRSLTNLFFGLPKLFDKMQFYIPSGKPHLINSQHYEVNDIAKIILAAGGEILKREPAPRLIRDTTISPYHIDRCCEMLLCRYYVIYDANKKPNLLYRMRDIRHVSSQWIIQCITEQQVTETF